MYKELDSHNFNLLIHTPDRRFLKVSRCETATGPLWTAHEYKDPAFRFTGRKWCRALTAEELFLIMEVPFDSEMKMLAENLFATGTSPFRAEDEVRVANEFGGFKTKARTYQGDEQIPAPTDRAPTFTPPFKAFFSGPASTPDWVIKDSNGVELCKFAPTTTRTDAEVHDLVKIVVAALNRPL